MHSSTDRIISWLKARFDLMKKRRMTPALMDSLEKEGFFDEEHREMMEYARTQQAEVREENWGLPERGTPQYLRARKVFMTFFEELSWTDGRQFYLSIGRKEGFKSQLDRMLARLALSKDMEPQERAMIRAWVARAQRDSWAHFQDLRARRARHLHEAAPCKGSSSQQELTFG